MSALERVKGGATTFEGVESGFASGRQIFLALFGLGSLSPAVDGLLGAHLIRVLGENVQILSRLAGLDLGEVIVAHLNTDVGGLKVTTELAAGSCA